MRAKFVLITLTFLTIMASATLAAPAKGPSPTDLKADREFVSACMLAFDQSSGNGSLGVGRQICECTVEESKQQGATRDSVANEIVQIKADSKYRIKDPRLLAAFQYCAIETMRQ